MKDYKKKNKVLEEEKEALQKEKEARGDEILALKRKIEQMKNIQ